LIIVVLAVRRPFIGSVQRGDKELNESKGHSAHYCCVGYLKETSTNLSSPRCSPRLSPCSKETSTNVSSPRHSPRRHSPRSKETARQAEKVVKKRSKGGVKKGSKRVDRPASFWFALCAKYDAGNYKSQCAFLRSKDSGDTVNSKNHQKIFQRKLKAYKEGKLSDSNDQKRNRSGTYLQVEEQLLRYIELRSQLYIRDKCGLTYLYLKDKALQFASHLGHNDSFKASNGWLSNVVRRGKKISIALHGEGMDMSPEMQAEKSKKFVEQLNACMEKYDVPYERLYNADQTGLFYNKMPNRIYLDKDNKDFRGVKQMKSKERVTLMVSSSAAGAKLPLFMVGTAKQPLCFKHLCHNGQPPMGYIHQANAWFTQEITIHWINKILWPWHKRNFGDVRCILLLDNCRAHTDLNKALYPDKVIIFFFPPNCTSFLQPADMGMIAGLKVGYRVSMLRKLLAICDDEELYDEALIAGKKAPKGCNGLSFCGKAHLLDAMLILDSIWSGSINKYCSEDSIKRCWRRSGLLSISTVADMNNDIGSSSLPEKHKKIQLRPVMICAHCSML